MRDDIRQELAVNRSATLAERTIDITTTGRRSGEPRRIEIVFYRFADSIYLSGIPGPTPRAWLLNLAAEPHFVVHLKNEVIADLPAVATVVTDPAERRRVFVDFVEDFNERHGPDSPWPTAVLEDWVARSPLAKVSFEEGDRSYPRGGRPSRPGCGNGGCPWGSYATPA
jgi:deazaflavin-dependent oxidoreductase (nitroreductase family)